MNNPIKTYTIPGIQTLFKELNQPSFRAQQLLEWLYLKHARSYQEMSNLPLSLKEVLAERYPLHQPTVLDSQISRDGTYKCILAFHDKVLVETVAIPSSDKRLTVCCSSQAGCRMACTFCATGKAGFIRNLSTGEIVDQVLVAQEKMEQRVSNVVLMGQGEPFLNYENTIGAMRILNNSKLLAIGARHITLSTCGIIPGIKKFSVEPEQFTLAISLHSAIQQTRDRIMPKVTRYPLHQLKEALYYYTQHTNRRVTLEYAMMNKINDSPLDLKALQIFCDDLLCHINLIPLNKIDGSSITPSSPRIINTWYTELNKHGIETTVRNSRGNDIAGACGQLKNAFIH